MPTAIREEIRDSILDATERLLARYGYRKMTVEDIARFAIALSEGQLVRPETLAKMWTKPKTRDGKESDYGFGFLIGEKNGQQRVFNDGSQAGTRTFLFIMPREKFAVSLMTNLEKADCESLTPKIRDIALNQKAKE